MSNPLKKLRVAHCAPRNADNCDCFNSRLDSYAGRVPDVVANVQLVQTNLLTVTDDYLPTARRTNLWGAKSHRKPEPLVHTIAKERKKKKANMGQE